MLVTGQALINQNVRMKIAAVPKAISLKSFAEYAIACTTVYIDHIIRFPFVNMIWRFVLRIIFNIDVDYSPTLSIIKT